MILLRIARRLNTFRVAEGSSNAQNGAERKNKPLHEENRFWDALAEHHAAIEDNHLDLASLRRIMSDLRSPVLVVGAGQGLLVAELQAKGFQCDGVDFSAEMIKHARGRRGLDLIQADASALQKLRTLATCWIAEA